MKDLGRNELSVLHNCIHRCVNKSSDERFFVAQFFDADPEAWIEPLSHCIEAKYGEIKA